MGDEYYKAEKMEAKINWETIKDNLGVRTKVNEYGLCSKCNHLNIRKTKLFDEDTWCGRQIDLACRRSKLQPNKVDPIIECSEFYPKGMMDMYTMNQLAYIIDIKKNTIGFNGETIVTITKPDDIKEEA